MKLMTIREFSKTEGVPETRIRTLVKQGKVPGIYSGTRFYVHSEMFIDQLEAECRATAGSAEQAAS